MALCIGTRHSYITYVQTTLIKVSPRTLQVAISVYFLYILITKVQFLIVFILYFRPSHQSLKSRDRGQGAPEDLAGRDFRRELEERERKVIDETYLYILKKMVFCYQSCSDLLREKMF